ncbi:PREDICTED: aspartic proteinase nepenthesin-2-like [Nelumbo nucifera]|uniref:Aspartic proteinase nepenthesin-2-like n=1 Tax=Nelumbo nucifera TaxID=4432 RepID=A0A1U8B412_NELNU|nr:PREDICTED: aspartic proteinase nepenthesin-2-like [Nelumbo nucifera]
MATQSRCTLLMAFLIIIAFSVTRVDNIVGFGVLRWLDTNSGSVTPVVRYGPKGHVVDIYVGTPPQRISALLSSSSSVIWLQARNLFPFNPRESSTLNKLPCNHSLCKSFYKLKFGCRNTSTFSQRYEDGTSVSGKMASDIFHMGDTSYNLVFGYTTKSKRYWRSVQGVLGMGRGNTSLIRQVGASRFSVCLTTSKDEERVTPLILGDAALLKPKLRNMAVRIPIVDNPSDPQHYYVALEGFSIGNRRVILPPDAFQILPNRTAGVIFDMGSHWVSTNCDVGRIEKALEERAVEWPDTSPNTSNSLLTTVSSTSVGTELRSNAHVAVDEGDGSSGDS